MLVNIEELAKKYVPIESNDPNKLITADDKDDHGCYWVDYECLFKIIHCHNIVLHNVMDFLKHIMCENEGADAATGVKKCNNYICATQQMARNKSTNKIPKKLIFGIDDGYIELEFCKIRKCSRFRVSEIYTYTDRNYMNVYNKN